MNTFIVVPEGLAQDGDGNYYASDYYVAVLELALKNAGPGDTIFLAPVNSFGAKME